MIKSLAILLLSAAVAGAGNIWTADRMPPGANNIPWSGTVGVSQNALIPGGIPNRTNIYVTLGPGNTAAQISSACQNCPSNSVVMLSPGTYNLDDVIDIYSPAPGIGDYFTLRGSGTNSTFLNWNNQTFKQAYIQVRGFDRWDDGYPDAASSSTYTNFILSVDAGYTQGSTNLTLHNAQTNILLGTHQELKAGTIITMDQLNDTYVNQVGQDGGFITNHAALRLLGTRAEQQVFIITSITGGTNLTVWPPVMMTNWQAGLQPQIWWAGRGVNMVGFENFTMIMSNSVEGDLYGLFFQSAWASWAKNILMVDGPNKVVSAYNTLNCEIRDCGLIDDQKLGSGSYGICPEISGNWLIENNWLWRISTQLLNDEGPVEGSVYSYNYCFQPWHSSAGLSSTQNQPAIEPHYAHNSMNLFEGNRGNTLELDFTHGSSSHITIFRNNLGGVENTNAATQTLEIINIQATNRYVNSIGNVLGAACPGWYTQYSDDITNLDPSHNSTKTIYCTGYVDDGGSGTNFGDTNVLPTMLIHDNWDSVTPTNGGIVFSPSITNRTLPNSLYLTNIPPWWPGGKPWPYTGPDLSPMIATTLPAQDVFNAFTNSGAGPTNQVYGVTFTHP